MARKCKGVHTSPETAGKHNLPEGYVDKRKDPNQTMKKLMPIWKKSFVNREDYKGKWDEESLAREINAFFEHCFEVDLKPSKAGLALWLALDNVTYFEWEKFPEKYNFKSKLIKRASQIIEMSYIDRLEKYPTGNIFLLKTSHGHVETSKVEVNASSNQVSASEVNDAIKKLGLDKNE